MGPPAADSVPLESKKVRVCVCVCSRGHVDVTLTAFDGWAEFIFSPACPLQSLFTAKLCNFRLFFYRHKMLTCIL